MHLKLKTVWIKAVAVFALLTTAQGVAAQTTRTVARKAASTTGTKPLVAPPGVVIKQDVAYLPADRNEKLDLYLPADRPAGAKSPVVVFIHGGGWVGGDKAARREYGAGAYLASHGYVCASVEYMKEAGKRWPTNLHDCKNAVRYLRKNAEDLQIDPERIAVFGGSAGGHLALMVAYTAGVDALEPKEPYPGVSNAVSACVDLYGIANLMTRQFTEKDGTPNGKLHGASALFSESREEAPEKWKLASPVNHVKPGAPPTMILHGTGDVTVDREQSRELARVLKEKGVGHELVEIPGAPHAFTLDDKRLPRDLRPEVMAFFDKHLHHDSTTTGALTPVR